MVADTYSARLGILKMGTGNQNNSWGDSFNASSIDIIDRAIAGQATHAVTGGTLDLSGSPPPAGPSQAIDLIQAFTGVLASNQTVILPNLTRSYLFSNATTGSFSLLVKTAAAANIVEIPQGASIWIFVAASNFVVRMDASGIGMIGHFGSTFALPGWMVCNGASLVRTDHPDLFNTIGTIWGAVDGTHFTLPLLTDTGRYLRSSSGSLTVGTYQSSQNLAHTHTASASAVTGTTDNPGNHTHANSLADPGHVHSYSAPLSFGASGSGAGINGSTQTLNTGSSTTGISITNAAAGAHTHNVTGTAAAQAIASSGGTEARPESAVVLICIKY